MMWTLSYRADPESRLIADRHYNRQKIGAPQFVPPGRCLVLRDTHALFVTSWPFAEFVKHVWAGAWINSLFRKECGGQASIAIRQAVAATRWRWPDVPALGMVSFVDSKKVPGVKRRGKTIFGYCYLKAGFKHVGFTKAGLWAWQLLPVDMPAAEAPLGAAARVFA